MTLKTMTDSEVISPHHHLLRQRYFNRRTHPCFGIFSVLTSTEFHNVDSTQTWSPREPRLFGHPKLLSRNNAKPKEVHGDLGHAGVSNISKTVTLRRIPFPQVIGNYLFPTKQIHDEDRTYGELATNAIRFPGL
jgi:hypothetical protein